MANKGKSASKVGLFILYEGLRATIIESQVIAHCRAIVRQGISLEVWVFPVTSQSYSRAHDTRAELARRYGIKIRIFRGIKPAFPFSTWANAGLLLWWTWRAGFKPTFVHARTDYAASVAIIAKRLRHFRVIWDARGDTLSEHREEARNWPRYKRWLAPLKEWAISRNLRTSAAGADAAIFVSHALQRLHGPKLDPSRCLILPCVADEEVFYYSPHVRASARLSLGFNADSLVLIYVGSAAVWQCVPETIALMEYMLRRSDKTQAIVVSPDRETFERAFAGDVRGRVYITSATLTEVNSFLNAADYGLLLRKPHPVNRVASPVKFAEYSLTGLGVITTDAVEQIVEFGTRIGNTIDVETCKNLVTSGCARERSATAERARELIGRGAHLRRISQFYRQFSENK